MISAPVGSTLKVNGKSMAMVAIGPTPGKTPINVPIKHPAKQSMRFCQERATVKPSSRLENMLPMN